jgi:hypothetical protein
MLYTRLLTLLYYFILKTKRILNYCRQRLWLYYFILLTRIQ